MEPPIIGSAHAGPPVRHTSDGDLLGFDDPSLLFCEPKSEFGSGGPQSIDDSPGPNLVLGPHEEIVDPPDVRDALVGHRPVDGRQHRVGQHCGGIRADGQPGNATVLESGEQTAEGLRVTPVAAEFSQDERDHAGTDRCVAVTDIGDDDGPW